MGKGKGRILLVDDEAVLLTVYARCLRAAGFEVEEAEHGKKAVELLQQGSFDAVLSDISMPQLDGLGLLREVRKRDLDLPVLLMTGSPSLETAEQAVEHGALRYLRKPVDHAQLVAATEQAVRLYLMARVKRQALDAFGTTEPRTSDRVGLEVSFDRALDGLWMAYQPIVSRQQRSVYAYEALLRSTDTTLPHPGAILAAAEQLGRLRELGRAVRAHVAQTLASAPEVRCFINLHPQDLLDDALYAPDAALSLDAGRITLEITERASLGSIKDLRERAASLRALGYRLAVDDLGAGYSGLASIAQLEPEVLKLDMSLVRGVEREPVKQRLVASITRLCVDMRADVIAEGVETTAERDCLAELGCDLLQGYLFAKPNRPFPEVSW